jgi:hypothetical protein
MPSATYRERTSTYATACPCSATDLLATLSVLTEVWAWLPFACIAFNSDWSMESIGVREFCCRAVTSSVAYGGSVNWLEQIYRCFQNDVENDGCYCSCESQCFRPSDGAQSTVEIALWCLDSNYQNCYTI